MTKTYFLGMPLFHAAFLALMYGENFFYRLRTEADPTLAAPAVLHLFIYLFLYFIGGYFLLSFFFGWRLGAKHKPPLRALVLYTLLTFVFAMLFALLIRYPYFHYFNSTDLWPVAQQTVGFLSGAAIARWRKIRKNAKMPD